MTMMLKQSSSRNQRSSRSLKLKQALQAFVVLAVFVWLLYQAKKSYPNNRVPMEGKQDAAENGRSENQIIKLGRKDLRPDLVEGSEKPGDAEVVELEDEEIKFREIEEEGSEELDKERAEETENEFQDFIDEDDKDRRR